MDNSGPSGVRGQKCPQGEDDSKQEARGEPQGLPRSLVGLSDAKRARLLELLGRMDLPPARVESLDKNWLLRNIAINNWDHPDFREAVPLLKML